MKVYTPAAGRHPQLAGRHPPPQADTPWHADTPPWQADTPPGGQTPPWQAETHSPSDSYCSGWYASYWNAFLFNFCSFFNSISLKLTKFSTNLFYEKEASLDEDTHKEIRCAGSHRTFAFVSVFQKHIYIIPIDFARNTHVTKTTTCCQRLDLEKHV